jgi:hypothetical protein
MKGRLKLKATLKYTQLNYGSDDNSRLIAAGFAIA